MYSSETESDLGKPFRENPYRTRIKSFERLATLLPEKAHAWIALSKGSSRPIYLDLGCGNGDFAVGLSRRNPEADVLGIEIKAKRVFKAAKKTERAGLPNVRFYCGDVFRFLEELSPGVVSKIFVNFPDPWPKRRQLKKRFIQTPVFKLIQRALKPGGELCVRTDVFRNAELALVVMESCRFSLIRRERFSQLSDLDRLDEATSYYERLWLRSGRRIYYLSGILEN